MDEHGVGVDEIKAAIDVRWAANPSKPIAHNVSCTAQCTQYRERVNRGTYDNKMMFHFHTSILPHFHTFQFPPTEGPGLLATDSSPSSR